MSPTKPRMIQFDLRAKQLAAMNKLEAAAAARLAEKIAHQTQPQQPTQNDVQLQTPELQKDNYMEDPRLCLTCVYFLEKPLSQKVHELVVKPLRRRFPEHHYYSPDSLHLTVQNVRIIDSPPRFSQADIETVAREFQSVFAMSPALKVELDGYLRLENSLALRAFTDDAFHATVARLRQALTNCGLPDDKQYVDSEVIFANVTVCRYTSSPSAEFLEALDELPKLEEALTIRTAALISTNLACVQAFTSVHRKFQMAL